MARSSSSDEDDIIVPVHAEDISVQRRRVGRGRVRVNVESSLRDHHVHELVTDEHVEIEHVPVGRIVAAAPAVRQEGDTTVIPVVEEIAVVERRLVLKEEIHLRRVRTTRPVEATVTLRAQRATIERTGQAAPDRTDPPQAIKEQHHDE